MFGGVSGGFDAMLSMELSPLHHAGTIAMGGHHLDQLVLTQQTQHMHHSVLQQEEPKKKRKLFKSNCDLLLNCK